MDKPLEGIRVVDWTIWQLGPTATTMMADLGAEVIKVEQTGSGDPGRGMSSIGGLQVDPSGPNFYFEACNRHKKSLAVDLKTAAGREIVHRLVERSDVFVQNFRQGVAERLELGYETLQQLNPRLIYASASGYGPDGPDRQERALDYLGQARSGFMYLASAPPAAMPCYIVGGIADQMGAIMLAYGTMVALLARERTGVGQRLDTSHLGAMIALQGLTVSAAGIQGRAMGTPTREAAGNPLWNHYKCQDGKWIALGMIQGDRYWATLCELVGRPELVRDPRFANQAARTEHRAAAIGVLDEIFASRPLADWLAIFRAQGELIYSAINRIEDLMNDAQVLANQYVVEYDHPMHGLLKLVGLPVKFGLTAGDARGRAPELGEHTEQILTETLGYSWDDVERLRQAGAI